MADRKVKDLRNIILLGHAASGKTSLAESILFKAKVTNRLGSVDDGNSIFDNDFDEIEKKISIDSAIAYFNWKDKDINIIDTPGYHDFISNVIGSMVAADIALIEISAVNGIQMNTRKMWDIANDKGLARAFVITKMDSDNVDPESILNAINDNFGNECIPLNLPDGKGEGFKAVYGTLRPDKNAGSTNITDDINSTNEKLIEAIVSINDDLTEKYLEGKEISSEELDKCMDKAIAKGSLVPIFFCSSRNGIGITEIIDAIADHFPSPEEVSRTELEDINTSNRRKIDAKVDNPFTAQVFKSVIDPFVGKLSYFRVFSGVLENDISFFNSRLKKKEKGVHIFRVFGKEQRPVESAIPGDIIAVSKLDDMKISDTLCTEKEKSVFSKIIYPTPMVSLALEPKSKGTEHKISEALVKLSDEDKTFKVSHNLETNELVVTGISNLHLSVMLERLKRRFHIDVESKSPKIPYKETITSKSSAKYKHKKQSGGHGQYGEVYLRIEPLERGKGFVFKNSIVGGSIPGQYIPAVEKGIKETLKKGILCGHSVVDLQVELYDGSFHNVDSSEAAFKVAASKALQEAFNGAKPVLLEPLVHLDVVIPGEFMGEISGNLSGRRGHIQGMDVHDNMQVIKAEVPMAEIINYESELMSITGGLGTYTLEFCHYDIVSPNIATKIINNERKLLEKTET